MKSFMPMRNLLGGLAALSLVSFGALAHADNAQASSNTTATAQQPETQLFINKQTKEVVRVDQNGTATPVSNEEMQQIKADADAQRAMEATELRGGFGGGRGGFGGGRGGFGGGRGGFGGGRGGFGGPHFGGPGFGRGGFGRGGFGRGGWGRGGGWRGGFGWAPYEPCDVYPYDPYYCY